MKKQLYSYIEALALALLLTAAPGPGAKAQSFEPMSPYGNITPSVETCSMTRYGSLVPSLYTGAMTYSLPVYIYQDPDFTIPVSLEYHYDGYKPPQHSGTVGLGWSLNCGGVITREIRGLPDEGSVSGSRLAGWMETREDEISYTQYNVMSLAEGSLVREFFNYPTEDDLDRFLDKYDPSHDEAVCFPNGTGKWYDTAPDLFHFDFLGYHGDFMLLKDGTARVYNANVPYGELTIAITPFHESLVTTISITDAKGYTYVFGENWIYCESAHTRPVGEENLRFSYGMGILTGEEANAAASTTVTAYHLCRITAPNGRTVTFNYDNWRQWELFVNADWFDKGNFRSMHKETVVSNACSSPLNSITLSDGNRIAFSYENKAVNEDSTVFFVSDVLSNSNNLAGLSGGGNCLDPRARPLRLADISVYNTAGELVDRTTLTHTYASSGTPRMFLHSVTGLHTGTHTFEYNLSGFTLPKQDILGYDHWGFWNGKGNTDISQCLARDNNNNPVTSLYGQMSTTQKDPDPSYSLCGALKTITYPTGGSSSIEYEANTVSSRITESQPQSMEFCTSWTVGGLRVKCIIDRPEDGGSGADTTSFLYTTPGQTYTSGILRKMPRHSFRMDCAISGLIETTDGHITSYSNQASGVSYSNAGMYHGGRDHFIAYPYVTQVHPDGSRTLHVFSVEEDAAGYGWPVDKETMLHPSGITLSFYTPHYIGLQPSVDRKNLRGLPESRTVYDAEGRIKSVEDYSYASDTISLDSLMFNEVSAFYIGPYAVVGASPAGTVRTDYYYDESGVGVGSLTHTQSTVYNAYGQKKFERTIAAGDTVEIRYRYLQETEATSPSGRNRLICDAARLQRTGGHTYLLVAEHYDYGQLGNPHPTRIHSSIIPEGADVTGLDDGAVFAAALSYPSEEIRFSYDNRFRLIQALFPGGATLSYTWDGNNVSSKSENGASNVTQFNWKDLVGLTGVSEPSGLSETYQYDDHNRPWLIRDANGKIMTLFNYHFKNE